MTPRLFDDPLPDLSGRTDGPTPVAAKERAVSWRLVLVALVALVPLLAALHALGPAEQSMLDAELRSPVYAVSPPATAAVVPTPTGDVPVTSTAPDPAAAVAVVTRAATRGASNQVTATVPAPAPTGLHGLPLAPAGLTACETAAFYRAQAGLPTIFDTLAYRESRCQPDATNWCCSGIWQVHKLWITKLAGCDVYVRNDLYDAQRNACAAAFVYAVQGIDAWSTA